MIVLLKNSSSFMNWNGRCNIKLTNDLQLNSIDWIPKEINSSENQNIVINGNNKTIFITNSSKSNKFKGLFTVQNDDHITITIINLNMCIKNVNKHDKALGQIENDCGAIFTDLSNINQINIKYTIKNCNVKCASLGSNSGGIVGKYFAYMSDTTNMIDGCSFVGNINGDYSGGIIGSFFGETSTNDNIVKNCKSTGKISGRFSGGIVGSGFCVVASGNNSIQKCTASGGIIGENSGGICGGIFCSESIGGIGTINDCNSNGKITGKNSGGISGGGFGIQSNGTNTINNCHSTGEISGIKSGGIVGESFGFASNGHQLIKECESSGNVTGKNAGGIFGESFAESSNTVRVTHCYSNGRITGKGAHKLGVTKNSFKLEFSGTKVKTTKLNTSTKSNVKNETKNLIPKRRK